MKLVQISVHFEYTDRIDELLEAGGIRDYVRFPMVDGRDLEGRHFGSQVFPGNFTVFHAQVPPEQIEALFQKLLAFREAKTAHRHLQALVLPIERRL
jgi:hypothetical protein